MTATCQLKPLARTAGRTRFAPLRPSVNANIDSPYIRGSAELVDRQWLDMDGVSCLNMPGVERIIPGDMTDLMNADPSPEFGRAVPFYLPRPDRFARHVLQGSVYA